MLDELNSFLENNNGYIDSGSLLEIGISKYKIKKLVENEELVKVGHGLYIDSNTWEDGMYIIQLRYNDIIFSHETALYLLDLAEMEPLQYTITAKSGKNVTGLTKDDVKVYKIKEELYELGLIETNTIFGNKVRCYNAERTLCDLFRSKKNIEMKVINYAFKEYLTSKDMNTYKLVQYAEKLKVRDDVIYYLEVLL